MSRTTHPAAPTTSPLRLSDHEVMANDKRPMTSDQNDEFITIAKVVKTQGRIGEVAAELFTDFPEKFAERKKLFALLPDDSRRELELEDAWPHKGQMVLKFVGVDSISDAEALLRGEIQIRKQDRAQLEADEVWITDLIGAKVFDHGSELGIIRDVQFGFGEAPMLIVAGKKEMMIPFAAEFISKQDLESKRLDMKLPKGLLDVDAPVTAAEKERQKQR
jgi:16S rRNA processing protein RimM